MRRGRTLFSALGRTRGRGLFSLAGRESPAGDTLKIAVLAALNIADEYFRARDEGSAQRTGLSARARELEAMLDLALGAADDETLARTAGSH